MKLKNIIYLFPAASLAICATSCMNEDMDTTLTDNTVILKASIGEPQVSSRASLYLSEWVNGKYVALKSSGSSSVKKYMVTNIDGEYADIVAGSGESPFFWGKAGSDNFESWMKNNYDATDPNGATFTASTSFSTTNLDKDAFLYATGAALTRTNNAVTYYHQNTRLTFKLVADANEGIFSASNITSMKLGVVHDGSSAIYTTAKWAKPSSGKNYGTWSGHGTATTLSLTKGSITGATLAGFAAMVIPYNYTKGVCIDLQTTKGNFYYKIPAANTNWQPGWHYTYTVTVHAGYVEITSVTATLNTYSEITGDLWQSEEQNVTGNIGEYTEAETNIFE